MVEMMTYQETTDYLFSQLPMFERQGATGYKSGLHNTIVLDSHFHHPHTHYTTIHIAGTNGKGSCSHTIAALLQEGGYKVGLYTSPHLVDYRERIRVNGVPISQRYVVDFVEKERRFFEPLHPTFFELTTAMALKYFRDEGVDIAVVEVGLGGRLDCTNIITPVLSIITNISYDHTQFLGTTLAAIAGEKAGIIKKGVPVVIGESNGETRPVFEAKAREMGADIVFAEDEPEVAGATATDGAMVYDTVHFGQIRGALTGNYQKKNTNTVLHAVTQLAKRGIGCCRQPMINGAFQNVTSLTGLRGRWETLRREPTVVCDTGHNKGAWEYLGPQLKDIECHTLRIVYGVVSDKDVDGIFSLLPPNAVYYMTQADNRRAVAYQTLLEKASAKGLTATGYPSVKEAFKQAMADASTDDFLFVGGSSYVVADLLKDCF